MLLIVALAFSLFKISRQQEMASRFYGEKEKAYHLAAGGLRIAKEFLAKGLDFINTSDPSTYPKAEKAPPQLKDFVLWFESKIKEPLAAEGFEINTPAMQELKESQPGAKLTVTLTLDKSQEIFEADSPSGIKPDPDEIWRQILLKSEAQIETGTFQSITSTITGFSKLVWTSVLPTIFGKFVLLVNRFSQLNLNTINASNSSIESVPLIVQSGSSANLENKWLPQQASEEIDKRGWIYISPYQSYILGASSGGGLDQYKEPFESFEPNGLVEDIKDGFLGSRGNYLYYTVKAALAKEYARDPYNYFEQADEALYAKSSILNLFGSSQNPSPTLIMGHVLRRILYLQAWSYSANDEENFVFPYLNQETFESAKEAPDMEKLWPGGVDTNDSYVVWKHFTELAKSKGKTAYELYKDRMSKNFDMNYNKAIIEFVKLDESKSKTVYPEFSPGEAGAPPPLKRLENRGQAVHFYEKLTAEALTIKNDQGQPLLVNTDLNGFVDLDFFKKKTERRAFTNQNSLVNFLKRDTNQYFLGGIVILKGDLVIEEPMEIGLGGGGILLVENNIEIRDRIQKSPGETLTLVALKGNIKVSTSRKIEAGLIARRGTIDLPYAVDIKGFVAAGTLILQPGSGVDMRQLEWDPDFDITDSTAYKRSFKASVADIWHHYVTGKSDK